MPRTHAIVEYGSGPCKGCGTPITKPNGHAVYKYAEDKNGVMTRTVELYCSTCCPICCPPKPKPLVPPLKINDPPLQTA
jgi:hypothetical protein